MKLSAPTLGHIVEHMLIKSLAQKESFTYKGRKATFQANSTAENFVQITAATLKETENEAIQMTAEAGIGMTASIE